MSWAEDDTQGVHPEHRGWNRADLTFLQMIKARSDGITPTGTIPDPCRLTCPAESQLESRTISDSDNLENTNQGKHRLMI